ncbi:MAG: hypothetical protein SGILL_007969 [Bacillariaceae sp.]
MEELTRRREERAIARESRRAERSMRSSQSNSNDNNMDSSDHTRGTTATFAAESASVMGASSSLIGSIQEDSAAATVVPASVTSSSTASRSSNPFAGMSEEERQRRYDAKMAGMDQQHQDNRERSSLGGAAVVAATTVVTAQAAGINVDNSDVVTEQVAAAGGVATATSSEAPTSTTSVSMLAMEEANGYQAKMMQVDSISPSQRASVQSVDGSNMEPTPSEAQSGSETRTSTTTSVFAGMSEDERERRYDAKMNDMSQGHSDNLEKRGNPEDDPAYEGEVAAAAIVIGGRGTTGDVVHSHDPSKDFLLGHDSKDFSGALVPDGQEQARGRYSDTGRGLYDMETGEYRDVSDNQLAVAIAIDIDEDEDETEKLVSVHAVEYDPDSKPPLYKNRRFRLYGFGGCCILLIILIVVIATSVSNKNSGGGGSSVELIYLTNPPTLAPTQAPTTSRESLYRNYFADELNSTLVYEQGTPHYMASEWIMNEDPAQLDVDSPRLLQRYMLAFWYYHTTNMTQSPWRSCNPPGPGDDDSCVFQEFGRGQGDAIVYTEVPGSVRWMSSQDECQWQGTICGDGTSVVGIRMVGQDLVGTLPTEMRSLTFLQVLQVHYNMFTGTIPPAYANFRHLLALELHSNILTGQIPTEFYEQESKSLIALNVGDNQLSGTLDTRVGQLTDLKGLFVFGNDLTGPIPDEIGDLKYLTYTRFFGNGFSGQLPSSFGRLPQLTEFWYNNNVLTGTIPSELGQLRRMNNFRLMSNRFSGPIPPELFSMTRATFIGLGENLLSGPLPSTELLQMSNLIQLTVEKNELTGTIPTELRDMASLRLVWLHINQFTGPLPDTICEANVPNGLNFIQADCAPLENAANPCRCCSACCDRSTGNCLATDNN